MRRSWLALPPLLAAALLLGRTVSADDVRGLCDTTVVSPAPSTGFPLFSSRKYELWGASGFVGDWTSKSVTPAWSIGLEGGLPLDAAQRARVSLYVGALIGHFGDEQGAPIGIDEALRFRWSPLMTDFLDAYLLVTPARFNEAFGPARAGYRPGVGLGVRLLRAASLEATFDELINLGSLSQGLDRNGPGVTITLGYDLCFEPWECNRSSPPAPNPKKLTCQLYEEANVLCNDDKERQALCQGVYAAMDATGETDNPIDATDAFLMSLSTNLGAANAELRGKVDRLRARHRELENLVFGPAGERSLERKAQQQGSWLKDHCSYEPTAIELRDALGCLGNGHPAATCAVPPECQTH